jgi:PAS domain S-box-containing protein
LEIQKKYLAVLLPVIVVIIFIIDLLFPVRMAVGLGYSVVLFFSSRIATPKHTYLITALSSFFLLVPVITGSFYSDQFFLLNRIIAAAILWGLTALLIKMRKQEIEAQVLENYYQEALRESQARLSGIVDSAMDAIITVNRQQNIILFNKAAEKLFGYSREELLGKHLGIVIPPDVRELHKGYVKEFGETGTTNRHMGSLGAVRGLKKSGQEFPIEASISQIETSGEKLYTVILRDITERELAKQKLLESENRFRNMADNAPVLIWISDEKGNFTYVNRTWLSFTGRSLEQEINFGWLENVLETERDKVQKKFMESFNKKSAFNIEFRLRRADGSYRWVINQGVPRFRGKEQFSGFIGSCIDINDRKIFEEQLNNSLKEKEVLLKEVHHRVKNNLQIVSSLLSLQSVHIKDEKMIDLLVESQNRIKSMSLIHEKLYQSKSLSKIEFDTYITELANNLLHSYLTEHNEIKLNIDVKNVEFDVDTGVNLGLIINELVSNSLKYAFPEKFRGEKVINISLSYDKNREKNQLIISDTGIGVPESFSIQEAESLGLQLVESLVEQISGSINYYVDKGTIFEIIF